MSGRTGAHVLYALADHDVATIKQRRADHPHESGNAVETGQQFPAFIVRDWGGSVNLRVLLDGHGDHWATSVAEDDHVGGEPTAGRWQPLHLAAE